MNVLGSKDEQIDVIGIRDISASSSERKYSKSLQDKLDFMMFEKSHVTAKDMLNTLQALKIRHKFTQGAVDDLVEWAKLLAGPPCENFVMSKYHVNIYNKDPENKKLYSFYCPSCEILLVELLSKEEITKQKMATCIKCREKYDSDTKKKKIIS